MNPPQRWKPWILKDKPGMKSCNRNVIGRAGHFRGCGNELGRLISRNSLNKAFQKAEEKFNIQQMKMRQLTVDLAARAYELENGHPPANIADLVPDYIKAVPQDPVTGTNLVYSP